MTDAEMIEHYKCMDVDVLTKNKMQLMEDIKALDKLKNSREYHELARLKQVIHKLELKQERLVGEIEESEVFITACRLIYP